MAVTTRKTYFATPNFSYAPDGLIKLGQLISDPKTPGMPICEPHQPIPEVHPSYFDDWEKERTRAVSGSAGCFAQFLAAALGLGGDLAGNFAKESGTLLKFRRLETFLIDPGKYVIDSMEASAVQAHLRQNPKISSLFMITGVRIARGAECTTKSAHHFGGDAILSADLTALGVPLSVGPKGSLNTQAVDREAFGASSDFVFAYSLRRISIRKKTGQITSEEYTKGAVYSEEAKTSIDTNIADSDTESPVSEPGDQQCVEFECGVEEEDFGSTFVPQGHRLTSAEDENGDSCRFLLGRQGEH